MATPSLFPLFMKAQSGGTGVATTVQLFAGEVEVADDIEVSLDPEITVELEEELTVEVEPEIEVEVCP